MLRYEVVQPNIKVDDDKRSTKSKQKYTLYRDNKSKPHGTIKGKGIVARLFSK